MESLRFSSHPCQSKRVKSPFFASRPFSGLPPAPAGANYIKLSLNGKTLGADVDGGKSRLINRQRIMSYKDDSLLTFFGPGGDEVDSRSEADRGEGYWYLLDISDAANKLVVGWDDRIESRETNKLSIINTYRLLTTGETAGCRDFVVENLEIGYLPESEVSALRGPDLIHMEHASGPSLTSGKARLIAGKDGALEFVIGDESYYIADLYSYPGSDAMRFNDMGLPSLSAPDWKTTTSLVKNKRQIIVTGEWKDYAVVRTISSDGGKFHISDRITNKTSKPLGMSIRYNAITNKPFTGENVFLCGSNTQVGTENCATNPSIFIKQAKSSIGLAVEDSVFRLQMKVARRENCAEFGTEHFGLEPGNSYTLEWTAYPSASTDYWDFVNTVRRDWKVNYTILGLAPLAMRARFRTKGPSLCHESLVRLPEREGAYR